MSWNKGLVGMPAKVSDEEFIRTWQALHGKTDAISNALGYSSVRMMLERRRSIERRHGIELISNRAAVDTVIKANRAVVEYSCQDGYVIVFGDAHFWPGDRSTCFRALLLLAQELKPAAIINNGDAFDGSSISRWPAIGWEKNASVKEELDACRDRLYEIRNAAKGARLFWCLGNHDARFESRLAAVASEYRGVEGIHLKDHFPEWTPCWRVDINGDTIVRHRENNGMHAGMNNARSGQVHIVTGHDHVAEVTYWRGYAGMRYACRHGMLADSADDPQFVNYLEAKAPRWQSAFAVLRFKDGQLLRPQLCERVDDGVVSWGLETFHV